jgi:hypothetical protein
MATLKDLAINFDNKHVGPASEAVVDAWELKASRRALLNLRKLLHDQPMIDLLKPQIEQQDALLRDYVAKSGGKFKLSITSGTVKGLNSGQFFGWMMENFRAAMPGVSTPEARRAATFKIGYPMHPEHYVAPPTYLGIVETMGGLPTRIRVVPFPAEQAPDFIKAHFDDNYPHKIAGHGELEDGTIFTYPFHQFRDTPDGKGFEMQLHNFWPVACPQIFVDEHEEHFAVEFRNSIRLAAEEVLGK